MTPYEQLPDAQGAAVGDWMSGGWRDLSRAQRRRIGSYALFLAVAALAFAGPLSRLIEFALGSELNSHIPLVPLIAVYLLYLRRSQLVIACQTSVAGAVLGMGVCVAALAGRLTSPDLSANDALAVETLAFVSLVAAGGFLFLGSRWMSTAAFPVLFLLFMIPMPDAMVNSLETASMLASADVAAFLLRATGTPLIRDGQVFTLPGIVLEVAQECSGIRSSWVLMITSLIGGQLFLTGPWRRLFLVAFVIPLGIVRNGFRILVIGLLCVYIDPQMIDSIIHRRGGPLFFALSLGPLFLLVRWLRRREPSQ